MSKKELAQARRFEALWLLQLAGRNESALVTALIADHHWVSSSLNASRTSIHERVAQELGWGVSDRDHEDEAHLALIESALAKVGAGHFAPLAPAEEKAAHVAVERALASLDDLEPLGAAKLNVIGNRRHRRKAEDLKSRLRGVLIVLIAEEELRTPEVLVEPDPSAAPAEKRPDLETLESTPEPDSLATDESERTYRTKAGRVLADADIWALSDEAERGYEID
jgi:hypothetical protein